MPASRSARKVTKKTPYAKPSATSTLPGNGKARSPKLRPSSMGPDANADEGLSPVVEKKKAARRRGKPDAVTTEAHSPGIDVDESVVPVANIKKGTAHRGKKGQVPSVQLKPTRALPNRSGRNVHPAGVPKSRRSKEQVDADRKAAIKASEEQAHKSQMAKDHLARMNILEDQEEDDLPTLYPQRLSVRINKRRHADTGTESEESFDIRVDEDSDLDSPSESDKATEAKPKRTKRIKGAARQELLSRTRALRLTEHSEKSQAGASERGVRQFTTQDLACAKYPNSGLRPRPPTPPNAAHHDLDPFDFGGLCEDDIEETRPAIVEGPRAVLTVNRHDLKSTSRKNELVKVKSRGNDVHQDEPQAMPKASQIIPTKTKATKAMVKQSLHNRQEHVNLNPLAGVLPDISQQCLNDARWTQIFLPTLTHALYISAHPFTDWTWCSSKFFDAVQKVFDLTFTNVSYTLRREDSIVKAAYDRTKTRRSKLANQILTLVKTFFDGAEFRNRPERIREYVLWALRTGGPAYYETPVPISCKLQKDDPNYPKPGGFLRSQFIFPIARTYVGFADKSVLNPSLGPKNPPMGMYALILTAVERAFRAYMTGAFHTPGDFDEKTTRKSMKDFYGALNQVRASDWEHALTFDSLDDELDGTESRLDESMVSAFRTDFYIPLSSPTYDAY